MSVRRFPARLLALCLACLPAASRAEPKPAPQASYTRDIRPLIERHCFSCHGNARQKGGVNFEDIRSDGKAANGFELWAASAERVHAGEMPPEGAKPIPPAERDKLLAWLKAARPKKTDCNEVATDEKRHFNKGYVTSRRLTRTEYGNSLRDLLGYPVRVETLLPADGAGGEGFDTNGSTLFTSAVQFERMLEAADRALAPLLDTPNPPAPIRAARDRLIEGRPSIDAVLKPFLRRAFRRAVSADEVARYRRPFDIATKRGDSFERALRLSLKAALISPHFLFLAEPEPKDAGVYKLAGFPLANRLSYFLWASSPDDELLNAAESGELDTPEGYLKQIRRMRLDPRSRGFAESFAVQWLGLSALGGSVRPDAKIFPEFDESLAADMREETVRFVDAVFRENRPLTELLDADYTFANGRLGKLYGLPDVSGPEFRRVSLAGRPRGGLTGHASVLTATSYPQRTSPVLRGRWVLEELLGGRVPPPPPDVPELKTEGKGVEGLSLRKQLELHRARADCAGCHSRMDPIGFGLETFDAIGRERTSDGKNPLDTSGKLPSGETFAGPAELRKLLVQKKRGDFLRNLTRKTLGYALGRELDQFDQCTIDETVKALEAGEPRPALLIERIATSYPFQHRYSKR